MSDRGGTRQASQPESDQSAAVRRFEMTGVDVQAVSDRLETVMRERSSSASFTTGVRRSQVSPTEERSLGDSDDSSAPNHSGDDRLEERLVVTTKTGTTDGSITYKPYGPHGAMAMVLGAILALPTLFISLLAVVAGYALYRIERDGSIPIERLTIVDGRVRRLHGGRTDDGTEESTVEVELRAEPGVAVDATRLDDADWTHRKGVLEYVRTWSATVLEVDSHRETSDDVFFGYLNMCWNRDAPPDVATVTDRQRAVFDTPGGHRTYRDRLVEDVDWRAGGPPTNQDVSVDLLEALREELEPPVE